MYFSIWYIASLLYDYKFIIQEKYNSKNTRPSKIKLQVEQSIHSFSTAYFNG